MTTAIIIVICIVVLSIGLFFLIKKLSNVSSLDVYNEEASIADFNNTSQDIKKNIDDSYSESNTKAKIALIISKVYNLFNIQINNIKQLNSRYKQKQAEKIKEKERAIQEAIEQDKLSQEIESKLKNNKNHEVDTSDFELVETVSVSQSSLDKEIENSQSLIVSNSDNKATDFVEKLLSEVDAIAEPTLNNDISDTYYYEYMEKRYIDRIVSNSKDIEAYKKLGDLYVDIRNYKDALEAFKYVLKLKPNDTTANRRVKDISNRLREKN